MTSFEEHLKIEISSGVMRLTINRPQKLNVLTPDIYRRIGDAVLSAQNDDAEQVIVLCGARRAFSAGFDLKIEVSDTNHAAKIDNLQNGANRTRWLIWDSVKPVVAAIHGYCLVGAFELTMPCGLTIAAKSTILGEPEILFGSGAAFMMERLLGRNLLGVTTMPPRPIRSRGISHNYKSTSHRRDIHGNA
ncbi:enoyl-CoA hydratase/isomerase family protein (plasmid) [Mesorhizobium sp. B2-1-8]|uniref:enoyl-CoA hydratase/isomerase family protein n=1 Tax=Mesorhizobium sp. B2-1-8 TaxID=2589967 RepID=UPI0011272AFC|nr:enoyl-CoA hydratase/isomerase family protein [Mesorhizobium sp. B2-1-8]UCI22817.1 enoyl-CoA hydratase/isomerase family protein [Mesorhizobium sp. B2-1-8]